MPEHQNIKQSRGTQSSSQRQIIPAKQIRVSSSAAIIQRARIDLKSLTSADVLQLQHTIGNGAVGRLLSEIRVIHSTAKTIQRQEFLQEEERQQCKFESEPDQAACSSCSTAPAAIKEQELKEEELLQSKFTGTEASITPDDSNLVTQFMPSKKKGATPQKSRTLSSKAEKKRKGTKGAGNPQEPKKPKREIAEETKPVQSIKLEELPPSLSKGSRYGAKGKYCYKQGDRPVAGSFSENVESISSNCCDKGIEQTNQRRRLQNGCVFDDISNPGYPLNIPCIDKCEQTIFIKKRGQSAPYEYKNQHIIKVDKTENENQIKVTTSVTPQPTGESVEKETLYNLTP